MQGDTNFDVLDTLREMQNSARGRVKALRATKPDTPKDKRSRESAIALKR